MKLPRTTVNYIVTCWLFCFLACIVLPSSSYLVCVKFFTLGVTYYVIIFVGLNMEMHCVVEKLPRNSTPMMPKVAITIFFKAVDVLYQVVQRKNTRHRVFAFPSEVIYKLRARAPLFVCSRGGTDEDCQRCPNTAFQLTSPCSHGPSPALLWRTGRTVYSICSYEVTRIYKYLRNMSNVKYL
jgi:hypothetical protein